MFALLLPHRLYSESGYLHYGADTSGFIRLTYCVPSGWIRTNIANNALECITEVTLRLSWAAEPAYFRLRWADDCTPTGLEPALCSSLTTVLPAGVTLELREPLLYSASSSA